MVLMTCLPWRSSWFSHCFCLDLVLRVVDDALQTVGRILELHRNPRLAGDVDHAYGDKYTLVDQMTNTALIGQVNALSLVGLTASVLKSIDKSKTATLRFQASDSCSFLKEQIVEVPDTKSVETDEISESPSGTSFFGTIKQVVHHVKEYHWNVNVNWTISIYFGTKDIDKLILSSRSSSMVLVTQAQNRAPLPEKRECKPLDLSLNWLVKHIDTVAMASIFHVDTQSSDTKTPRRNPQVEDALSFMIDLSGWTRGVRAYFNKCVQQDIVDKHNPAGGGPRPSLEDRLTRLRDDSFVPVQPLFEEGDRGFTSVDVDTSVDSKSILSLPPDDAAVGAQPSSVLLTTVDMHKFLTEQVRSTTTRLDSLRKMYPAANKPGVILSVAEASLVLVSLHSERVVSSYIGGVDYVEQMLDDQLVSAIGKRVEVSDIDQFLRYHNARLLRPVPQPFCHAIRLPGHYPCGILSIEGVQNDGKRYPIETLVREIDSVPLIQLPLNAATTVELTGKTLLHGWIQHRFGPSRNVPELIVRARQFSSFLLVVGTMAGPDKLEPKDAIIVQNKDELIIPLILDEIPSAKEFKDAIRSLSPEQQRFAQSFRKMQLGSSVLGISVIQIKPQLEALLGLPPGALTKEMKLTQDLMELFVEYQVPSDMLSYDGIDSSASPKEKVDNVRVHVQAVSSLINEAKTKELKEQSMKAEMAFHAAVTENPMHGAADGAMNIASAFGAPTGMSPLFTGATSPKPGGRKLSKKKRMSTGPSPSERCMMMADVLAPLSSSSAEFSMDIAENFVVAPSPGGNSEGPATTIASDHLGPSASHSGKATAVGDGAIDFTLVPKILDAAIEQHAQGAALRSTTIKLSDWWTRSRQDSLLVQPTVAVLNSDDLKMERNKAMDLLDALSRSGSLTIPFSELHVIVSVTHCFENDIIQTIIQDNINPIEKLEQTTLLVGSAIYGVPAAELISNREDLQRLRGYFPALLGETTEAST